MSRTTAANSRTGTAAETLDKHLSGETHPLEQFRNTVEQTSDRVGCLQLRGEYMFVAEGRGGFRVYDVASIANKGTSERILTAPFSPLGHDTHVGTTNATCMALATDQPVRPDRNRAMAALGVNGPDGKPLMNADGTRQSLLQVNQEQPMRPIYSYAVVTDAVEGLVLVDVTTMADGEFRNNKLKRARLADGKDAWNLDGALTGSAAHRAGGQHRLYRRSQGPGGGGPVRPAPAAAGGGARAARHARLGASVPLSVGHRRAGARAVRRYRHAQSGGIAAGDRALRRMRAGSISRVPTPMSPPSRTGWQSST